MSMAEAPLDDELREVLADEETLADVVVSDIAALPWPAVGSAGGNLATQRAGLAARVLAEHGTGALEVQSAVIDLVSDLLHLGDALVLDMDYVLEMAYANQRAEKDED